MQHQRHVGLVAANRRQHIARFDDDGESLRLSQRRDCFIEPAFLCPRDARQRVHHRQVAAIAGGMKRRRGLRDVLVNDRHVADVAIAEAKLVVGQPDSA